MKYKIGDRVTYLGDQKRFNGMTGTILYTKEVRTSENDIGRGALLYPKDGYDYTIRFIKYGLISTVLDVLENEIS